MFRDGPLSRRPPEEIRYGTGKSKLGPILVAEGDKGLVTIMIRGEAAHLLKELRRRFPKADLIHDDKGCRPVVARAVAYVAMPVGRFGLPLDLRGTELQQRVWNEVRKIPFGQTSTYTKIAAAIGAPKAIRAVASSCSRSWFAFAIPCHRVLHTGAAAGRGDKRNANGVQYRWADYEARLAAKRAKSQK
jgi:AraC family transcriptional regulator of adaptative response/methylated-DNA-[protein]-cysteine methyltransferase